MSRILFAVFTFVAILGLSCANSRADDLQDVRKRAEIAASKIRSQVDDTLNDSRKQNAADARFSLLRMIREVKDSRDLQQAEKATLLSRLEARLRIVENGAGAAKVAQDTSPSTSPTRKLPPVSDPAGGVSGVAKKFIEPARTAQQTQADLIREREKNRIAGDLSREKSATNAIDKEMSFPANSRKLRI